MSTLRALNNTVLFSFLDDTVGAKGRFTERTKGSIIIPILDSAQHKTNRWGQVISVGPKVDGINPGDYILIEALQWTPGTAFEADKIWKTDDTKIIVVTDDVDETFTSL